MRLLATDSIVQYTSRYQAGQGRNLWRVRPNGGEGVGVHDDEAIVGVALEAGDAEETGTTGPTHQWHTVGHTHHIVLHGSHTHWLVVAGGHWWSGIGWLATGRAPRLLACWLVITRGLATRGWERSTRLSAWRGGPYWTVVTRALARRGEGASRRGSRV